MRIGRRDNGAPKDTALNIETTAEFVVNLVTEDLLSAMNISAADFPPAQSELIATGLRTAPSERVWPPRLALAQASKECRLFRSLPVGTNTLSIGEELTFHVAGHWLDPDLQIDDFALIGRLGSPPIYCRTDDRFAMPRVGSALSKGSPV